MSFAFTSCAGYFATAGANPWGQTESVGNYWRDAQPFTVSSDCYLGTAPLAVYAKTNGAPTVPATFAIETTASSEPSGTILGSVTIPLSTYTSSAAWATSTFPAGSQVLSAGATYWLVLEAGADNTNNYSEYDGTAGAPYSNFQYTYNGSTWSAVYGSGTHNLSFELGQGAYSTTTSSGGSSNASTTYFEQVYATSTSNGEEISSPDAIQFDWLGASLLFFICCNMVVWYMRKRK